MSIGKVLVLRIRTCLELLVFGKKYLRKNTSKSYSFTKGNYYLLSFVSAFSTALIEIKDF